MFFFPSSSLCVCVCVCVHLCVCVCVCECVCAFARLEAMEMYVYVCVCMCSYFGASVCTVLSAAEERVAQANLKLRRSVATNISTYRRVTMALGNNRLLLKHCLL